MHIFFAVLTSNNFWRKMNFGANNGKNCPFAAKLLHFWSILVIFAS